MYQEIVLNYEPKTVEEAVDYISYVRDYVNDHSTDIENLFDLIIDLREEIEDLKKRTETKK